MAKRKQTVEEDDAQIGQANEDEPTPKRTRSGGKFAGSAIQQNGKQKTTTKTRSSSNTESVSADDTPEPEVEDDGIGETNDISNADEAPINGTPSKHTEPFRSRQNGDHPIQRTPFKGLLNKKLFSTPSKNAETRDPSETPRITRNADRSARRKTTRSLIERTILGNTGDNDEDEDEEDLAGDIYGSDEEDDAGEGVDGLPEESSAPVTPSKRGRPKGSKVQRRSPTPPEDLAPHEKYFFHNRGTRAKTSNNNLSSLALLDHEEYFSRSRNMKDPHVERIQFLEELHTEDFRQWQFELSQQFNICIYGWGSKKSLLMKFADHIYKSHSDHTKSKIVVVNGYVQNLTVKDILNTVAAAVTERGQKLGAQAAEMFENLVGLLEEDKSQEITLIIHSIDRPPLRRPTTQSILSRLGAHPQVHMVASADHPSFPLLWDSSLRSSYNFLFHDCTTFQPYTTEIDVVDEVHELLGRSGRRVGGKEGVSFVLKSLPENAKNLFRVLIAEQLASMDAGSGAILNEDENDGINEKRTINHKSNDSGVEYRVLYKKAVEEFICSNDMAFRTLLKE